jgi:hypothetical protein
MSAIFSPAPQDVSDTRLQLYAIDADGSLENLPFQDEPKTQESAGYQDPLKQGKKQLRFTKRADTGLSGTPQLRSWSATLACPKVLVT